MLREPTSRTPLIDPIPAGSLVSTSIVLLGAPAFFKATSMSYARQMSSWSTLFDAAHPGPVLGHAFVVPGSQTVSLVRRF